MQEDITPLQRFIRAAIDVSPEKRDFYDKLLQAKLGTKGKPIYDIDRGKSKNPSLAQLNAISEVLKQPRELFERAIAGEDVEPVRSAISHVYAPPVMPDIPLTRSINADEPTVELASLDLSYSMGPGTELESYIEQEPIRFDPVFIRRLTRAPYERLKLARGVGDSMQPTLLPGDVVMIDTTQNMLNMSDRVYAVALHGAAAIKRIRLDKGCKVLVVSDNPAVENYTIDAEDVIVHGRVIWFGREL
ncbi:helix-turn-helix transcriptional regulator [Novosphingobium sp. 9]|uniref:S24 family peptidase n=1 Tax=Novosphingobium sp. 9 TaxID=2025349 RepID=UPI0021B66CD4|nr:S24 family peptidase [Novosphingobium sp. 9]